jgi:hypothetical protein
MFIPCILIIKCFYIQTYAQISIVNLYYITPTSSSVNTLSSGRLQDVFAKVRNY